MKRYKADIVNIVFSGAFLYFNKKTIIDVVHENNDKFTIWQDNIRECIVVECENKPKNMMLFGVLWEEDVYEYS